jgi:hypothetical protein
MSVFRLAMLPASEGDCLILSYGPDEGALRHVVIDGGRKATWPKLRAALEGIAARGEAVDLLLLSHIDADHIDGLLELAEDPAPPVVPAAVWYNGFDELKTLTPPGALQPFGFKAGDAYSKALAAKGWPLNAAFGGKAIFVEEHPAPFAFAGLELTLVSPSRAKLNKLRTEWNQWRAPKPTPAAPTPGAGLQAFGKRAMPAVLDVEALSAPSGTDSTAPNGSSIALVAEYDGRRVLLAADAHPDVLLASLTALGAGGRYPVDLVKLPHHGSRANLTREVIEALDCRRFAVSTNGTVFGHPDPEAISRVLKFAGEGRKTLYFNYASDRTRPWDDPALTARFDYECVFPSVAGEPLVIQI